jgi:hypothetical protein
VKRLGEDLHHNKRNEDAEEDGRPREVAPAERHRHGVAARLTERGRQHLEDPEPERDLGHFAQHLALRNRVHGIASSQSSRGLVANEPPYP